MCIKVESLHHGRMIYEDWQFSFKYCFYLHIGKAFLKINFKEKNTNFCLNTSDLHSKFWLNVKRFQLTITLIRLDIFRVAMVLSPSSLSLHTSTRTNLTLILTLCKVKQPVWSRLKVKKSWHNLLHANVISFSVTRKYQKIRKIDENS